MIEIKVYENGNEISVSQGHLFLCLCQRKDIVLKDKVHLSIQTNTSTEESLSLIMPYIEMFHSLNPQ